MHEKYYTVEEIAEMIKIHPKTVQRYIREGKTEGKQGGKELESIGARFEHVHGRERRFFDAAAGF